MAKEGLTVTKDIYSLILGVNVFVKASTVVHECVLEVELNCVGLTFLPDGAVGNLNAVVVEVNMLFFNRLAINLYLRYLLTMKVHKPVVPVVQQEARLNRPQVKLGMTWNGNLQVVVHI